MLRTCTDIMYGTKCAGLSLVYLYDLGKRLHESDVSLSSRRGTTVDQFNFKIAGRRITNMSYVLTRAGTQRLCAGFVVFLFGGVGFTHIYLPNYSPQANDRRHRDALTARKAAHAAQAAKKRPSMWKALDDKAAQRR